MARRSISREGVEVHTFSWGASIAVPLFALAIQASLPLRFPFFAVFDLPLLTVLFFSVARRNPIAGAVTGCVIGIAQDALTQLPIGLFGMAKTIVGYIASSIGAKVDVENPGSRLIMTFCFFILHRLLYQMGRSMAQMPIPFRWGHELAAALANALLAVVLFVALDRLKQRK